MIPKREEAENILKEAEQCNPGPWGNHSRVVAACAEKIALSCEGMNSEKAYVLGLLHDIGRKFGTRHMGHIYDGYRYMLEKGYDEAAKICLTHSFPTKDISTYIGNIDIAEKEYEELEEALDGVQYDDYDRLIQLCDSVGGAEGVMKIEDRMNDVKRRYGSYPQDKWDKNIEIKTFFEEKIGKEIYDVL